MSAPFSNDDSPKPSTAPVPAEESDRGRFLLARKWAYLISSTAYLPLTHAEIEQHMLHLVNRLFDAVRSEPFEAGPAAAVGTRLVELQCVGPDSIRRSVEVLGKSLLHQPELLRVNQLAERVVLVLGSMMSGYTEKLRQVTQKRQEDLNQSLLKVARDSRRGLLINERQFEEVFSSSASGIALIAFDGRFLRANAALAEKLNRSAAELAELTVFDVVHPDDATALRGAYQKLLGGQERRLRQECRLMRADGETVPASFAGSVVRDGDGAALHVVTIIEDDTEVSLLRRRLGHQSLHDPLTGLPNRQFFTTRLESALRQADPKTGITLYHLDLDGFSLITDGLGYHVGDQVLKSVAERLKTVVADEKATVARIGGDEFGIFVENTSATPDVGTMVGRIHRELAEPVYPDGHHGLAASASIGVVRRPESAIEPAELLRAADMTLRRAKSDGRGQWQLFDPARDTRDRQLFSLAASMPGAWENGEIVVAYRPLVRLADEGVVGIEAVLRWDHPELGPLSHTECAELAEETGLSLPLGYWLLRSAGERVRRSGPKLLLSVGLTKNQAADPDLVGEIRRILDETGLSPDRLRPGVPVQALLDDHGEAVDNMRVLADIGTKPVIRDFAAVGDLACLEDLPAHAVRVARRLVEKQAERADDSLVARALTDLVEVAHLAGAKVIVDGVETRHQADWWHQIGGDIALGGLFPAVPDELTDPE